MGSLFCLSHFLTKTRLPKYYEVLKYNINVQENILIMMLLFYNAKLWLGNHTKTTDLNEMHKFLAKLCSYKEAKKKIPNSQSYCLFPLCHIPETFTNVI